MKADESSRKKAPLPKADEKKGSKEEPDKDARLLSKLKWPELPTRQAIGIPLAVLVIALLVTGFTWLTVGAPLHLGLEFKGGTSVTIKTDKTDQQLQEEFSSYPLNLITRDPNQGTVMLRFSQMGQAQLDSLAAYLAKSYPGATIEHTGSTFSAANQGQAVVAIVVAFALMAVVIFIIFRDFVPCIAVITSAFSDIMITVALMNVFHIELTFGTFAALLMLIGYSVDTDILLTTKVLGEKKYLEKKIASCRATGLTMSISAIVAFMVLYLVSTFSYVAGFATIPVLSSISIVIIFGLLADLMNTWFLNAGLLKWYMESPQGRARYA
ncbi:Preprotein translocase subunit SecF [Methanocella conradii HZ254]|uniref:Protein-export membrane protein SecF n=1 Tax=Methanocella conradii (strain DSM 24694 / JCM 17849 / CGMCC 1.5162 / HZ254) TaxID=1041930 RepID=H8I930_METCZ|nr:protein translocase subunit SecF [Methanocella conradii]AFC99033.1 Preprotein translocase subunit SecF [Methanocella conradii HZ254]